MSIVALFPQIFAVCQTLFLIGFNPAKKEAPIGVTMNFFALKAAEKMTPINSIESVL